jgi:hypothetical protein
MSSSGLVTLHWTVPPDELAWPSPKEPTDPSPPDEPLLPEPPLLPEAPLSVPSVNPLCFAPPEQAAATSAAEMQLGTHKLVFTIASRNHTRTGGRVWPDGVEPPLHPEEK